MQLGGKDKCYILVTGVLHHQADIMLLGKSQSGFDIVNVTDVDGVRCIIAQLTGRRLRCKRHARLVLKPRMQDLGGLCRSEWNCQQELSGLSSILQRYEQKLFFDGLTEAPVHPTVA